MNDERDKDNMMPSQPQPINELGMQNAIRKRYCQNWPATILELTKRVQAVNQTWAKIVTILMQIDGLRISWQQSEEYHGLVITVRLGDKVETHEIPVEELQKAYRYIEVLLMDKLDHSKLIKEAVEAQNKEPELPG